MERLCVARFPVLVKRIAAFQYWCNHRVSAYAIHCVAIQNVRPAPTNAVFFPSAQMKNKRHKSYIPTETRAIPSLTQTDAHNVEVAMSDLHRISATYIDTNHAVSGNVPPQRLPPGEWRGVGEIGRDSQIRTITLVIVTLSL